MISDILLTKISDLCNLLCSLQIFNRWFDFKTFSNEKNLMKYCKIRIFLYPIIIKEHYYLLVKAKDPLLCQSCHLCSEEYGHQHSLYEQAHRCLCGFPRHTHLARSTALCWVGHAFNSYWAVPNSSLNKTGAGIKVCVPLSLILLDFQKKSE